MIGNTFLCVVVDGVVGTGWHDELENYCDLNFLYNNSTLQVQSRYVYTLNMITSHVITTIFSSIFKISFYFYTNVVRVRITCI